VSHHHLGLTCGSMSRTKRAACSIPKREEPGKTGAPCVKVPGSSRVPSLVRDERTHPHRPRLVVSHSTCPTLSSSPPREQLCNRSCSNKLTKSRTPKSMRCVLRTVRNDAHPRTFRTLADLDYRDTRTACVHAHAFLSALTSCYV